MSKLEIAIDTTGELSAIYSDDLADLIADMDQPAICRVSNVEPDAAGGWTATMDDGTQLGSFKLRQEALDAEIAYLRRRMF